MSEDPRDPVVRSYSERAETYDLEGNLRSCWGEASARALERIELRPEHRSVVEVGCGTGHALRELAAGAGADVRLTGIEPADNMRARAEELLRDAANVRLTAGRFEELPLDADTVDYLYSIMAFHWTTDVDGSVRELARVLKPGGEIDLFFTGRHTGREFTRKTTPVFLKYLGPAMLLQSATVRKHLTRETAEEAFAAAFPAERLAVSESYETYHDDLDGHWSWWVARAAGHFTRVPDDKREQCDADVRAAIASLEEEQGIPYTVHVLHVRVGD